MTSLCKFLSCEAHKTLQLILKSRSFRGIYFREFKHLKQTVRVLLRSICMNDEDFWKVFNLFWDIQISFPAFWASILRFNWLAKTFKELVESFVILFKQNWDKLLIFKFLIFILAFASCLGLNNAREVWDAFCKQVLKLYFLFKSSSIAGLDMKIFFQNWEKVKNKFDWVSLFIQFVFWKSFFQNSMKVVNFFFDQCLRAILHVFEKFSYLRIFDIKVISKHDSRRHKALQRRV